MFKKLLNSIDKKEWRLVILMSIFVVLITTLPYVYGWHQTPANRTYTGLHSLTPGDVHVYFSWMEQVKQGHFISKDLYTNEPQARVLLNSFWSVEGLIAKYTHLSNNLVFQLSRIILIPLFLNLLYLLSAFVFQEKLWRKVSFIFLSLASGWGFLISIFLPNSVYAKGWYNWPLDLWAPESNNLLTMFQSPHLILSTSFIILILILSWWAIETDRYQYSLLAGLIALAEFQFHPFHAPTIFGVLAGYFLAQLIVGWKKIKTTKEYLFKVVKHSLVILLVSLPSIIYWLALELTDMVTQIRTYQNVCLTPPLWITLISYGLLMPLAGWAIYKFYRADNRADNLKIFFVSWLVVQFALLYAPLAFQRRLMQGLQIPMIILAVWGLKYIYESLQKKLKPRQFSFYVLNKPLMIMLFIFIFTGSNLYNWIREMAVFAKSYRQLYIDNDVVAGYNWLKNNTPPTTIILSDLYNGNLIPGRIGRFVYVGHGVETLFFESKLARMAWFFSTNRFDNKKIKFLKHNRINYVFYSPNEKGIGKFNPDEKPYLKKVFQQGNTSIYQVSLN